MLSFQSLLGLSPNTSSHVSHHCTLDLPDWREGTRVSPSRLPVFLQPCFGSPKPLHAVIASGLGTPHGSRKQQSHFTSWYTVAHSGIDDACFTPRRARIFHIPCWFERFCLFCYGPKLVGVAPVSERPRWPFCNCPSLWLMRTLHPVLLSCLGVCYDWCCVVPSTHFLHRSRCFGMCVLSHSLFNCFVFAHMFGWCEFCVVFAPLSVRSLRLLPWRLVRAVLCGSEYSGEGVRRQVCVCVKSVRHLLVLEIAAHHGSCLPCAMSQKVGKFG